VILASYAANAAGEVVRELSDAVMADVEKIAVAR
jgi:hypothetical protein